MLTFRIIFLINEQFTPGDHLAAYRNFSRYETVGNGITTLSNTVEDNKKCCYETVGNGISTLGRTIENSKKCCYCNYCCQPNYPIKNTFEDNEKCCYETVGNGITTSSNTIENNKKKGVCLLLT